MIEIGVEADEANLKVDDNFWCQEEWHKEEDVQREKFGLVLEKEEANDELLVELEKAEESKYFSSMEIVNMDNIGYFDVTNMEYCWKLKP